MYICLVSSHKKRSKNKFRVDFLGLGAEKAGTTWIADCIREHPEVFVPQKKEIFFFNEFDPHYLKVRNPKYGWGMGWYESQFAGAGKRKTGELSPTYLYCSTAAKRIKRSFPDVKLIVVLRDPVKRAFSQYIQDRRFGLIDNLTFGQAVEKYDTYIEKGLYYKHLKNYLKLFPKKNLKVMLLNDIKRSPESILKEVYKFLDLENTGFKASALSSKSNPARDALFIGLNKFMISVEYSLRNDKYSWMLRPIEKSGIRRVAMFIRDINSKEYNKYPSIDKKTEQMLRTVFRKDVKSLEKLLKRNLSLWQ